MCVYNNLLINTHKYTQNIYINLYKVALKYINSITASATGHIQKTLISCYETVFKINAIEVAMQRAQFPILCPDEPQSYLCYPGSVEDIKVDTNFNLMCSTTDLYFRILAAIFHVHWSKALICCIYR